MATQPVALQLRYLQALTEVATEQNSMLIVPIPIDILTALLKGGHGPWREVKFRWFRVKAKES